MAALIQKQELKIFPAPKDLFLFAASDFKERAIASVNQKGIFSVVLSGGNTPKLFFDTLVNQESLKTNIPWDYIQFFFGDERYVPKDNEESNYHTAYTHLFSKVPVKEENIYPMPTELKDPANVASQYALTLRKAMHTKTDAFPVFDLCYLGLGANAHTASLMPKSDLVSYYAMQGEETLLDPLAASLYVPNINQYRITLTPPLINHSKTIIFLVTGDDKSQAVKHVLQGPVNKVLYPAQLIHAHSGITSWYLDQAAAYDLTIAKG